MQRKLEVVITGNNRDLRKTFGDSASDANSFAGKLKGALGGVGLAVGAAAVAGIAGVGMVLKGAYDAAIESQKISAESARVIESMGASAWISADGVGDLATRISNLTAADDEMIQGGANLLLTFGNIKNAVGEGNDVFDRAVGLSLDMSKVLGTDMNAASLQLGKALNDPIKGVTQLTRSGVSFTQQQKDQITAMVKSGDLLGAQKVMLDEVGKQFGGAAAAAATPTERLGVVVGNLQEQLGSYLIPIVSTVATWFADKLPLAMEAVAPVIEEIGGGLQAFFGALVDGGDDITSSGFAGVLETIAVNVRNLWDVVAGVDWGGIFSRIGDVALPVLEGLRDVAGTLIDHFDLLVPFIAAGAAAWVGWQVVGTVTSAIKGITLAYQALSIGLGISTGLTTAQTEAVMASNAAWLANPIVLVVAALVALGAALYVAYENVDWFRGAVDAAWDGIQAAISWAWEKIQWVFDHWELALGAILGPLGVLVAVVVHNWDKISGAISWAWSNVISPVWDAIVAGIRDYLIPYWQELWSIAQTVWGGISAAVQWAWGTVIQPIWDLIQNGITFMIAYYQALWSIVQTAWGGIAAAVSWAWGNVLQPIWSQIQAVINTVLIPAFNAIKSVVETVWSVISSVISGAWGNIQTVFGWLTSAIDGVKSAFSSVADVVRNTWSGIAGIIQGVLDAVKNAWNNTVGGKGISIPEVFGFGGVDFTIPRLHSGGTVIAPTPGGEVLVLARDRETISAPRSAISGGASGGGGVTYVDQRVYLTVDGSVITRGEDLAKTIADALNDTQRGRVRPMLAAGVAG